MCLREASRSATMVGAVYATSRTIEQCLSDEEALLRGSVGGALWVSGSLYFREGRAVALMWGWICAVSRD